MGGLLGSPVMVINLAWGTDTRHARRGLAERLRVSLPVGSRRAGLDVRLLVLTR